MTRYTLIAGLMFLLLGVGADALPPDRVASDPAFARGTVEPFEALALSWRSAAEDSAVVRVRVSADGEHWSAWREAPVDHDTTDVTEGRFFSAILHFDRVARFVQTWSDERVVRHLTVSTFPLPSPLPLTRRPANDTFMVGGIEVRSRTDWGCPDGQGSRWTPVHTTVTHLIVHHTAGANELRDWDSEIRNIWQFHTITNGWGDIGYNFLIAPNGVVYEGRAGGNAALGAHFSCRNTNTMGVALLGTYTSARPTDAALASLKAILRELAATNSVSPLEVRLHVPSGLTLSGVSAHRDGNPAYPLGVCTTTSCPGEILYGMLPAIRAEVACVPPLITAQPVALSVVAGASAGLTAVTSGTNVAYQWYEGASGNTDVPVSGGTSSLLTVSPTATTSYWVRASNSCGQADSASVAVTIISAPSRRRSM